MSKPFSIFTAARNDHSKIVRQLLSNQAPPSKPKSAGNNRPQSGVSHAASKDPNGKPRAKGANPQTNNVEKEAVNRASREDLLIEMQDVKKKCRSLEESTSQLKVDNQRLEAEAMKQQRRIDQLLNLAEGAKNVGLSTEIRRDIEKSILVRQLKNQINQLRVDFADKEAELDNLRRHMKATHVMDLQNERDEYYAEVQRLKTVLFDLKDELVRERQRREWNSRVAGDASDDLRKEVARLSTGYQSILTNISNRASGTRRPVSATGTPNVGSLLPKRPHSASGPKPSSLANYYQPGVQDESASPPMSPMMGDPLDNFGLPGDPVTSQEPGPQEQDFDGEGLGLDLDIGELDGSVVFAAEEGSGVFKAGDRVQALYQGGVDWYDGVITAYHTASDTYAISYDDGDEEKHVPLSRMRDPVLAVALASAANAAAADAPLVVPSIAAAPASHPALSGVRSTPAKRAMEAGARAGARFSVGEKVEALYYHGTTWYLGKIQAVHPGEGFMYDVAYNDGDRELKVPEVNVRLVGGKDAPAPVAVAPQAPQAPSIQAVQAQYSVGDRVNALYDLSDWFPGTVAAAALNDGQWSYDVEYDDGDKEYKVAEVNVQRIDSPKPLAPTPVAPEVSGGEYQRGDRVQGYFEDLDVWFDGTVTETNADNTYFVNYDDGDEEAAVPMSRLRSIESVAEASVTPISTSKKNSTLPAPTPTPEPKFKVGDRVEGLFGGADSWYVGSVVAVARGPPALYSLHYDDGDRETEVPESLMRVTAPTVPSPAPTAAPEVRTTPEVPSPRRPSNVDTNLDSFLNDLSEDESTGALDGGPGVTLKQGAPPPADSSEGEDNDGYDEDFDA